MTRTRSDKNIIIAAILSINDGLVSNFLFIMTLVAAGMDNYVIVWSGIGEVLAGAISMGIGEWRAVSSVQTNKFINSLKAATAAFFSFAIGSLIPVLPFIWLNGSTAVIVSGICSVNALFVVGVVAAKRQRLLSGLIQLACGIIAAVIIYWTMYAMHYFIGIQS